MIKLRQFISILVLAMLFAGCEKPTLPAGGFAAKAELSADSLLVGDVVTLTLTARHPAGSVVKFPTLGNRKEVILRGRSTDTTELTKDVLETEEIVRLTSLRVGNWLITTNVAVCTFSDGSQRAQELPPLFLTVTSSLTEENATILSDIKGPIRKLSRIIWVPLLIIGSALLVGLLTLLLMKHPKKFLAPADPVIPPHVRARNALAALKNHEWLPEPFFVDLSLILRTYLEDRFNLKAPESTTEELAETLKNDPRLDLQNRQALQCFFEQSDLVKFARAGAEQAVMQTAFSTVETFIDQTVPSDPTE